MRGLLGFLVMNGCFCAVLLGPAPSRADALAEQAPDKGVLRQPEAAGSAVPDAEVRKPLDKQSAEARALLETRQRKVRREIVSLQSGHPWAGFYYRGDGLGKNVYLELAPESGFVFRWAGCVGLYDFNFGQVTFEDGRLELQAELENEEGAFQGIATKFTLVHWGKRRYLIERERIVEFCNAVMLRREPRNHPHGRFLMGHHDAQVDAPGDPVFLEPGVSCTWSTSEP